MRFTQNATPPRWLDGYEPNLGTMFPLWGGVELSCAQLLDPDQDPDCMSLSKFDIWLYQTNLTYCILGI